MFIKSKDIIDGQIYYNKWEVLIRDTKEKTEHGNALCKIRCIDCGDTIITPQFYLGRKKPYCNKCKIIELESYIGQRFGKLIVIKYSHERSGYHYFNCKCDCGNENTVQISSLNSGSSKSCGCLLIESHTTHGFSYTRIYRIFAAMLSRCYNSNTIAYKDYGGRGITICDQWYNENGFINFYNWSLNNGYNDNLSIDRIDNNLNYSPENCRWTTPINQSNNRRNNHNIDLLGNIFTMSEISRQYNIPYAKLSYNINKNDKGIYDILRNDFNIQLPKHSPVVFGEKV